MRRLRRAARAKHGARRLARRVLSDVLSDVYLDGANAHVGRRRTLHSRRVIRIEVVLDTSC